MRAERGEVINQCSVRPHVQVRPGKAFRLFTEAFFEKEMRQKDVPEMQRSEFHLVGERSIVGVV